MSRVGGNVASWHRSGIALVVALSLSGCMSAPKRDLDAERIAATLGQLESDPVLGTLAPAETTRAREALRALNEATGDELHRTTLAYVAERRVDVAYAAAQAAAEERKLAELDREKSEILVEASRRDAELSRLESEKLRVQGLARAEEAERLRAESAQSAQSAADATAAAEQAQRVAAAQSEEASLARREAELAVAAADSLRVQMQNLTATRDRRGQVMTLGESVFRPGKATLEPEAADNLDSVVAFVNADATRPIRIEGHTDDRGGANLNQVLSQRRAEAVRDALVAKGVDASRISAVGRGEDAPIATNDSEQGRARNRRVEVVLLEIGG